MDITELLKDSDPLIVAVLLNERLPKRYRMFLLWLLSLDQRNYAGIQHQQGTMQGTQNPAKSQAMFLLIYFEVLLSNLYITYSNK